jgi:hypothetical protein
MVAVLNVREQVADLLGVEDRLPSSGNMVLALNLTRKHVYAGTVHAEVLRRRKANKVARASRRRNRGRR